MGCQSENLTFVARWCKIIHEVTEEVIQLRRKKRMLLYVVVYVFVIQSASKVFPPLSEPALQSTRWTGRCATCISASSPFGPHTDGTIAESGRPLLRLTRNKTDGQK